MTWAISASISAVSSSSTHLIALPLCGPAIRWLSKRLGDGPGVTVVTRTEERCP